jgi:hypothetical protein
LLEIGPGRDSAVPKRVVRVGIDLRVDRFEGGRWGMKRIRLLVLLSVIAVALPFAILSGVAKATGSTGSSSSLSINENAQFDVVGSIVHVGLRARCPFIGLDPITHQPIPGTIDVHLTQDPPESVVHAEGDALVKEVVCDGQTHSVGASVFGANFDAGRAYATATFTFGGTASAARWISIIVMPG